MKTVKLTVSRNSKSLVQSVERLVKIGLAEDLLMESRRKEKELFSKMRSERAAQLREIRKKVQWVWALNIDSRRVGIGFYEGELCSVELNTKSDSKVFPVSLAKAVQIMCGLESARKYIGNPDAESDEAGWLKYLEMIAKM